MSSLQRITNSFFPVFWLAASACLFMLSAPTHADRNYATNTGGHYDNRNRAAPHPYHKKAYGHWNGPSGQKHPYHPRANQTYHARTEQQYPMRQQNSYSYPQQQNRYRQSYQQHGHTPYHQRNTYSRHIDSPQQRFTPHVNGHSNPPAYYPNIGQRMYERR